MRNRAANDIPGKFIIFVCVGFNPKMNFTKLTGTACLFFVAVHGGCRLGDGFLVRYLGFMYVDAHLELGFSAADGGIDVLISHTLQNGLEGCIVIVPAQGHIFFA